VSETGGGSPNYRRAGDFGLNVCPAAPGRGRVP
jgi:hypothetical protein